ncbi:MAG: hypothetical protein ACK4RM_09475 [Flavobacterium sp.]
MKKLLFLSILILSLSCSNSDDEEGSVKIDYTNVIGFWEYKEKIMPDGSVLPYEHLCVAKKDHWELRSNSFFYKNHFLTSCSADLPMSSQWFLSSQEKKLQINNVGVFQVRRLSKNEMILDNFMSNGDLFYTWVMVRRNQ